MATPCQKFCSEFCRQRAANTSYLMERPGLRHSASRAFRGLNEGLDGLGECFSQVLSGALSMPLPGGSLGLITISQLRDDLKLGEYRRPECRADGDVGGIASARHQDAASAGFVVARV